MAESAVEASPVLTRIDDVCGGLTTKSNDKIEESTYTHTHEVMQDVAVNRSSQSESPSRPALIDPVPMSLPAILVEPRARSNAPHKPPPTTLSPSSGASSRYATRTQPLGKRKLIRQSNSRFASNPHAVRPRRSDFFPAHTNSERSYRNLYTGSASTPLVRNVSVDDAPRDGREMREWMKEWTGLNRQREGSSTTSRVAATTSALDGLSLEDSSNASDVPSGMFTMSLPEARTLLKRRVGVTSRRDRSDQNDDQDASPMQSVVDAIEDELEAWKTQVVYRSENTPEGLSRIIVHGEELGARPRVVEQMRLPHTLVYEIDDSFDRLIVHSLARIWGLRSFSKASIDGSHRLTHILKPPEKRRVAPARQHHPREGVVNPLIRHLANGGGGSSPAPAPRPPPTTRQTSRVGAGGLDTPPTTDVGSEADSASEFEGWTEQSESEVDVSESEGESDAGDAGDAGATSDARSEDGRPRRAPLHPLRRARPPIAVSADDSDDAGLGDVEEEAEQDSEVDGP